MAKERSKASEERGEEPRGRNDGERGLSRSGGGSRQPSLSNIASPFALMRRFVEDLDELFEGMGPPSLGRSRGSRGAGVSSFMPPIEAYRDNGELVIRADVPGLSKDEIQVEFENDQLVISGERRGEDRQEREGFYSSECSYGQFCRVIPLPEGIDPEQAKAKFANGVLEVRIPVPQRAQPRRIEVREGEQESGGRRAQPESSQSARS